MTGLEERMNMILERLGLPLRAVWCPDADNRDHARIDVEEGLIIIYDENEDEALKSLFHECLEYRLRSLISPYRELVNKLIEVIEKITYKEKEHVLDQVWNDMMVWRELGEFPAPIKHEERKHERG